MGSTKSRNIFTKDSKKIDLSPPNTLDSKIGHYLYPPNETEKKYEKKWDRWITKGKTVPRLISKLKEKNFYKGIPQKYRWNCWKILVAMTSNEQDYLFIPTKNDYANDIEKDIGRTFPKHLYFDKKYFGYIGQFALKRILSKFSHKYSKIGYCQGMNFIAGYLLLVSGGKESEVFQFMENLYSKFQLQDIFGKELKGLHYNLWIFDNIFKTQLCKLYWHFKNEEISEDMWVLKFFLTLFTSNFSIDTSVYFWDLVLLNGFENVHKIVLALLKMNQHKLLTLSTFEILEFFNSLAVWRIKPQKIIKIAAKLKIKNSEDNFEREYKSLPCPDSENTTAIEDFNPVLITSQLVTEDAPIMVKRMSNGRSNDYRLILNPFFVEESNEQADDNVTVEDSFNAEDVLNNLVTENDWETLYNI